MKYSTKKLAFILSLCFVVFNALSTQAQILTLRPQNKFGIKLSTGMVTTKNETINLPTHAGQTSLKFNNAETYYGLGLWSQHQFGWLYSEANIIYNRYGMNYIMQNNRIDDVSATNVQETHSYVSSQIIAGLKYNNIRIGVGPGLNFATGYQSNLENQANFEIQQRNISFSFSGAIGIDIQKFSFDLQFEKAFRSIGDHIYSDVRKSRFTETPDILRFNVAYQLF